MALPVDPTIQVAQHFPCPDTTISDSDDISVTSSLQVSPAGKLNGSSSSPHNHHVNPNDNHHSTVTSAAGLTNLSGLSQNSAGLKKCISAHSMDDEFHDQDEVSPTCDARTQTNAAEVQLAYGRIRNFIKPSPLYRAHQSLVPGMKKSLWIKAEQTLPTGSFKVRGACNALLLLTPEERARGVIAASAGNHAQALAYFAKKFGIKCTIYLPTIAPLTKIQSCIALGAEIVIVGENLNLSRDIAMKVAAERNLTYIHGFNDPAILNGAGSCGIEIMEQIPDVEVIIVSCGGGGLIGGVALAAKQRNPKVKIISIEPEACPSMMEAHKAGKPVAVKTKPTLADGTAVPVVGDHAFRVADPLIDEFIAVDEKWICLALVRVLEVEKVVLEGCAALGIAAFLSGQLEHLKTKKCCVIFTGGNIDITSLGRVIDRGLLVDQRQLRLRANISDQPGSLVEFLQCLSESGASVKDIYQERGYTQTRAVWVRVNIETRGKEHTEEVLETLAERRYHYEVEKDIELPDSPPVPKLVTKPKHQ